MEINIHAALNFVRLNKLIANPIATILSAAMLLRYSLNCAAEADAIEAAVDRVLQAGWRTADIAGSGTAPLSCTEMTEKILAEL